MESQRSGEDWVVYLKTEIGSKELKRLHRAVQRSLTRFNNEDREGLTQEAFKKFFEHPERFSGTCLRLKIWLIRVAQNLALDSSRKTKWLSVHLEPDEITDRSSADSILEALGEKESLRRILSILSFVEKHVFSRRVFFKETYAEIADDFSTTEVYARQVFVRAKRKLLLFLVENGYNGDADPPLD